MLLHERERVTGPAAAFDAELLIEEARRRGRRRRVGSAIVLLVAGGLTAVAVYVGVTRTDRSAVADGAPAAGGLCVKPASGWQSRSVQRRGSPPALLLTNFRFGRAAHLNGNDDPRLRWPRGGILISINDWTGSATSAMRPLYQPAAKLRIAARDFSSFEGVSSLGQQHVLFGGRLLEVWVQARPTTATTIAEANHELARVNVCG
jgi:hypothetical protein